MTSNALSPRRVGLSLDMPSTCSLGLSTAAILWMSTWAVFSTDLSSVGAVALSATGVFLAQLGALYRAGRRADREILAIADSKDASSHELAFDVAHYSVVQTLLAAALVGPLLIIISTGLLGVRVGDLLPLSLVPFFVAQIVIALTTFISVRGTLRRRAIDFGITTTSTPSSTLVRGLIVLTFVLPIPLTLVLVISGANALYFRHSSEYHKARLSAQAHALFGADGFLVEDSKLQKLTPFEGYRPFARQGKEEAKSSKNASFVARPYLFAPVGIEAALPCQGMPLLVVFGLVLVGLFASLVAAARVFTIMTKARRQLTARLDALPERLIRAPFDSPMLELTHFADLLARLKARFDEMRQLQRRSIESGRKDRELKAQFFAGMSHDLRSPLNSIIGFTDLLLGGIEGELTTEQKQAVLSVSAESEKLMSLIADILDTSKLDAGRFDLEKTWVPPVEIVSGCTAEARRMLGTKAIEITPAVQAGLPPVYVDKSRIQQALIGLITRAIQNAQSGAFRIKAISERMSAGQQMLRIDIIDASMTLSDAERMLISEAMGSASNIPARGGTGALGLGIALARDLIHLHHGELAVYRSGSIVFSVRLPLDEINSRD
ncbi:MAG: hypothetical protein MUC50_08990 [Myxococcota bacterium]|jgi:signal transduction histidine kinase|nr:hypothetical protein [Myxococcota bacterium]